MMAGPKTIEQLEKLNAELLAACEMALKGLSYNDARELRGKIRAAIKKANATNLATNPHND